MQNVLLLFFLVTLSIGFYLSFLVLYIISRSKESLFEQVLFNFSKPMNWLEYILFVFVLLELQVPIPPEQIYAINDTLPPEGAAEDYESCLKQLVWNHVITEVPASGLPRFDLMLLGMGPDGHVASLFPGHPLLKETQKWVTYIKDSPKPPPERITFTFPVINASAYVAMVVTGSGKAGAVHKALSGGEHTGFMDRLPVEMVELEQGEFTWFTDKAAVSMLNEKSAGLWVRFCLGTLLNKDMCLLVLVRVQNISKLRFLGMNM